MDGIFLAEMKSIAAFEEPPETDIHELALVWELTKESYREHDEEVPIAPS